MEVADIFNPPSLNEVFIYDERMVIEQERTIWTMPNSL